MLNCFFFISSILSSLNNYFAYHQHSTLSSSLKKIDFCIKSSALHCHLLSQFLKQFLFLSSSALRSPFLKLFLCVVLGDCFSASNLENDDISLFSLNYAVRSIRMCCTIFFKQSKIFRSIGKKMSMIGMVYYH